MVDSKATSQGLSPQGPSNLKEENEAISYAFFINSMNHALAHWMTLGVVGALFCVGVVAMFTGPIGMALGVGAMVLSGLLMWGHFQAQPTVPTQSEADEAFARPRRIRRVRKRREAAARTEDLGLSGDEQLDFLALAYGVLPSKLAEVDVEQPLPATSRLLQTLRQVERNGFWGGDTHAYYLAHAFNVAVYSRARAGRAFYDTLPFNTEADQRIDLINRGRGHWLTTVTATNPVGVSTRQTWDNLAGGDCFFYAFSLGLARIMKQEFAESTAGDASSKLFDHWCELDPTMKALKQEVRTFVEKDNPRVNKSEHLTWGRLQRSLRHIVSDILCRAAREEAGDAARKYKAEPEGRAWRVALDGCHMQKVEGSHIYREFSTRGLAGQESLFASVPVKPADLGARPPG